METQKHNTKISLQTTYVLAWEIRPINISYRIMFKLKIIRDNGNKVNYKTLFYREVLGRIFPLVTDDWTGRTVWVALIPWPIAYF